MHSTDEPGWRWAKGMKERIDKIALLAIYMPIIRKEVFKFRYNSNLPRYFKKRDTLKTEISF